MTEIIGSTSKPVVEISGLSYRYPETDFPVLQDINLIIDDGDFALLIGPSGSGKSTLLQTFNGIIPRIKGGKLSGHIVISGKDVTEYEIVEMAEHVSLVFQDAESQLTSVFVEDEIAFGPENFKVDPIEIFQRIDSALSYVGLKTTDGPHVGDRYVYEMSGGQQQRLAIGSVLAIDAKLLVLDDPTANLDPVGTSEVLSVLERLRNEGRTILLATHWMDEFIQLATKLIVMNAEGGLLAYGEPREILSQYGTAISDELGIWLPQLAEVDLAVRGQAPNMKSRLPLTVSEATSKYRNLHFGAEQFKPRKNMQQDNGEIVLEARNLDYSYPDGTQALKNVSFQVKSGLLTGILGPNGAGKSTLASLMVGLKKATKGEIYLKGDSLSNLDVDDVARQVGFVFQNPEHQFVRDTVRDEIAYSLKVLDKSSEEIETGVNEMLSLLKLKHLENRHPFGLSGGEKRRLSVAVMLVAHPELLILDEPTYGQDRRQVHNIMHLVEDQLQKGVTVLMITHDMRLVENFSDEVLVLDSGQLIYSGRPEDMFDSLGIEHNVTLKATPLQRLIRDLQNYGKDIHHDTRTVRQFVDQILIEKVPNTRDKHHANH